MDTPTVTRSSAAYWVGGATYIGASIAFLIVFSWLAVRFGYPDVLDRPASDVLPQLLALGGSGRAVWALYAILPLTLIVGAVAAADALGQGNRRSAFALRLAVTLQVISSLAMTLGLARWSTAQWILAEAWPLADPGQQRTLAVLFDVLNSYLGNAIGEFVGELTLYGSFAAFAVALWQLGRRRIATFAFVTTLAGMLGMFRNMTSIVGPAAEVSNVLLPLFMIGFGVALLRRSATRLTP